MENIIEQKPQTDHEKGKRTIINRWEYIQDNITQIDNDLIYKITSLAGRIQPYLSKEERKTATRMAREVRQTDDKEEKAIELLDFVSDMIFHRSIIEIDKEVDFKIPEDPEELRKLQNIIKNPIERRENERIL